MLHSIITGPIRSHPFSRQSRRSKNAIKRGPRCLSSDSNGQAVIQEHKNTRPSTSLEENDIKKSLIRTLFGYSWTKSGREPSDLE
ncbi:hypothetical protein JTE90_015188 [Oedothorax gibbosus]|uniref:Uncharacterized protein n=1 Tax=Oedothorax gibbosus TaxID=931172 RepID=A0AAV6V9L6_9ARAC|nr:hypothetical protein JTE90_015188 [Oedothorax gibbosus]